MAHASIPWVFVGLAALTLASCAATATSIQVSAAQPAYTGKMRTGTIAANRESSFTASNSSSLQAVLTALNQNPPRHAVQCQEIVIRLSDGNPVAFGAISSPNGASTGQAAALSSLTSGNNVAIIQGSQTTLIRRN